MAPPLSRILEQLGDDEIRKHRAEFITAHCYQLMGDKQSAIKYYKMGLEQQTENERAYDMANRHRALHNMGCAHYDEGEYVFGIVD